MAVDLVRDLVGIGIIGIFQEVEGETRECQILLDNEGHPTEVYERGATVTLADWQALIEKLPEGQVIMSGSFAAGLDDTDLPAVFSALNRPIVDNSGAALKASLSQGTLFIKPNAAELAQLLQPDRGRY